MNNNWKTFRVDTNWVWGIVDSKESWEDTVKTVMSFNEYWDRQQAINYLLYAELCTHDPVTKVPYFDLYFADGKKKQLRVFFKENGMPTN